MFLVRFGGELLSHVLRRSTIAAAALNFRDRDGIGCFARAVATKPEKKHISAGEFLFITELWSMLLVALIVEQFGFYWIKSSLSSH